MFFTVVKRVASQNKTARPWWIRGIAERNLSSGPAAEKIVESPFGSIDILVKNVSDYCLDSFDPSWDSLPALVCGVSGKELTYRAVIEHSRRFGSQLLNEGLNPGDKIGVIVPNCPEFGPILFGATGVGVTVVPISPLLTPPEIRRIFDLTKPKFLISIDPLIPLLKAAQIDRHQELPIVTLTDNSLTSATPWEQYISNDGSLYKKRPYFDPKTTLAILPFSSGTTGPPKGVMVTHYNLASTVAQVNDIPSGCLLSPLAAGECQPVALSVIPPFHIYGLTCNVMQPLTLGVQMVSVPRFEPSTFINCMANHPPTYMNLVPPLVSFLALNPAITKEKHLSRLVCIASGGSPISTQILRKFRNKISPNNLEIKEGYGLTEAAAVARATVSFQEDLTGSVGRLLPNTKAKVVNNDTGATVGPGHPGELCIKGPQVTMGYFDNQQATNQALDGEGWFHTGDIVTYDEDGYFYIVDRIKDMIKVKGYQVSPTEVEEVVRTMPDVMDVAVIGVKDDVLGEAPKAFIVRMPEDVRDENTVKQNIHKFLEDKLAAYKHLAGGIVFVKELPKSPTGKVLRNELRNILKHQ